MLVEAKESLFRQVTGAFYQAPEQTAVLPLCFMPTKDDTDGLSLVRALHRSAKWAAFRPHRPDKRFRLAPVGCDQLIQLGFNCGFADFEIRVSPDQTDAENGEPHAHCLATSINSIDYADPELKARMKEWAEAVVKLIDEDNILGPFDPPTDLDSYRP